MKIWITFCLLAGFVSVTAQVKLGADKLYEQASDARDAGQYKQALALLNTLLTETPSYTDAYFARASTREQLHDLEGALTDYSVYLERKPNDPEALFSRGILRYQLKKYDQAYEDFTQYLKAPPGATQTIFFNKSASASGKNQIITAQSKPRALIYNYLGLIDQGKKNLTTSIHWLDSAIMLSPNDPDFYVNRGVSKQINRDSTMALADFQKALSLNANHTGALYNLAVYNRTKGKKESDGSLDQAIDYDSSMLAPYLERAFQRMEGGYLKGALDDYNHALEIETRNPEIWLSRGIVRERMKDFVGAFSDYTKAIEIQENFVKAWINRANVLVKMDRFKDAVDDYTAALVYVPESAAAYYNRAIARYRLNTLKEACDDLKKSEALGQAVDKKLKTRICGKE
jgi:tetratricopeptide (TPR) repeat protein